MWSSFYGGTFRLIKGVLKGGTQSNHSKQDMGDFLASINADITCTAIDNLEEDTTINYLVKQ